MSKKIIASILIGAIILLIPASAIGRTVIIDENTFNQLVTRAREADVLEKEVIFYKEKYNSAVEQARGLSLLYSEDIAVKDAIIAKQESLVNTNMERIKNKDDIISLQDEKIHRIERSRNFKNIAIGALAIGGASAAANNDKNGLALGLGLAGLLAILIK